MRNTRKMIEESAAHLQSAVESGMMQVTIGARQKKTVSLPGFPSVTEFINCSYLGLDTHPDLIAGAKRALDEWGIHFCCARSRFSIQPNQLLEEELSALFGGRAITFPSVTSAHLSTLPLLAAGVLFPQGNRSTRLIFDRFAHASMQVLKPILAQESEVVSISHNHLEQLLDEVTKARQANQVPIYVADGVYSMGGVAPLQELLRLAHQHDFYLYIDDAHGTSLFGSQGEGYCLQQTGPGLSPRIILTFSLAKGFGCNGGGVLVPHGFQEKAIRSYGTTYGFSAPLDFSVIGAALASVKLHKDGTVARLQQKLWSRLREFAEAPSGMEFVSPIAMVPTRDVQSCLEAGTKLKERGYFVSTVFFPVVARDQAQLRLCVSVDHSSEQLAGLRESLHDLGLWPPEFATR